MAYLGKIVVLNLTELQQQNYGGNHSPNGKNKKQCMAFVTGDNEDGTVNLRAIPDSSGDFWEINVSLGNEAGQFQVIS